MAKGYSTLDVTDDIQGRMVMKNMYWLCKDSDPKQAIFFNDTAQCNQKIQIPQNMIEHTKQKTGWDIGIVFLETSYRPRPDFY